MGVGSVCRRQSTAEATTIMTTLAADGFRLHGFGFKKGGLKNCHKLMTSADSTAWSDTARQNPICLPQHHLPGRPEEKRPKGHKNCANCLEWALIWRRELLRSKWERKMPRERAVVLLSGGLDSSTVLAIARERDFECYALSFAYGQRHKSELVGSR